MTQPHETSVDIDNLIGRIQAVARGELPDDAVSVEELRSAIAQQRKTFAAGAVAPAADGSVAAAPKRTSARKPAIQIPDLDLGI